MPGAMKLLLPLVVLLGLAGSVFAAPDKPYVLEKGKRRRITGDTIQMDSRGNIKLTIRGVSRVFRYGSYAEAYTPKDKALAQIERDYKGKRYAEVIAGVDRAGKYKRLGWGGRLAYWKGQAQLAQKAYDDARATFEGGLRYTKNDKKQDAAVKTGIAQTLISQEKFDEAEKFLETIGTTDEELAPRLYHTRGFLQEKKGQPRDAVREYLKVVLMFPKAGDVRRACLERVVALLRGMKDNRAADFEKMLQEYTD